MTDPSKQGHSRLDISRVDTALGLPGSAVGGMAFFGVTVLLILPLLLSTAGRAEAEGPSPKPPSMRSFDPAAIDSTADPCVDFYQYACGGWHTKNPMPPDVSFWSRPFTQFSRQIEDYVRGLIEGAARGSGERSADEQKIGDYYAACVDTTAIEERGLRPLQAELALIDGMTSVGQMATVLGTLSRSTPFNPGHGEALFYVFASGDPEEGWKAARVWIGPQGMGLPGRDYYLRTDDKSQVLRGQYKKHIARMLRLLGEPAADAASHSEAILALEAVLAEAHLPNRVRRNAAAATSNPMTPEELQALTPHFRWLDFFRAQGLPRGRRFNVMQPAYLVAVEGLLQEITLDVWKAYLRWNLIAERSDGLPAAVREAHFSFFGQTLRGEALMPERGRVCIEDLERNLPDVLSRVFASRVLRPELRSQTVEQFEEIKAVLRGRIRNADWMQEETKRQGLEKLDSVRLSVGQPESWLDDPRLVIRRDDYYGNVQRAGEALRRTKFGGLGKPVDLDDWELPATWVGAYQINRQNAIVITAAYLLLVDDGTNDPAVFYSSLGAMLAHELIHGFDPLGRSYDAEGRLRDWWTEADAARFDERARCVAEQFSRLEYAPGIPLDGAYLVSEQMAELSASSLGWEAYQKATRGQPQPVVEGLTPIQRYLVTSAQTWCAAATQSRWRALAASSAKAWAAPMVNGTVLNLPEFADAFGCHEGQPMVKPAAEVCQGW